jgi:hypothetical protein
MADYRPVSREGLNELAGEALPERAAMSLINANVAVPVNAAVAANALTDHSTADATSAANGPITQQPNLQS